MYVNGGDIKQWNIANTLGASLIGNPFYASLPGGFFNISYQSVFGPDKISKPVISLQTWKSIGLNTLGGSMGNYAQDLYLKNLGVSGLGNAGTRFFTKVIGQQTGSIPASAVDDATK